MELNTISQSDFTRLATMRWLKSKASLSNIMRNSGLFKIEAVPANTGETREYSEIDLNEYASNKSEGDQAERASVQQGYRKTITAVRRAKDIGITVEMRKRNKAPEVIARLTNLGKLIDNRLDLDLTHVFTFGWDTSYTDMDGATVAATTGDTKALFYSAHLLVGADEGGSSTTYRNALANNPRLSKGSLEGIERLVAEETYNYHGELMAEMPFDVLWTGPDPNTVNTAQEYLKSTADPDGAHSGTFNGYASKYRHLIIPRLATTAAGARDTDKRYYWGIASTSNSTAHLGIWEETFLLTPDELGKDSTESWNYGARGSYGWGVVSGSFVKGSKGDGSA